jgi:molybdenum cofactor cytidylyltransferase
MIESKVSAILLAAGPSHRMRGRDKLMLPYGGKSLLQRAVALLDSLPFRQKILVTTKDRLIHVETLGFQVISTKKAETATQSGSIVQTVRQSDSSRSIRAVINTGSEISQSASLKLGLEAGSAEWFLFLAADQPLLTPACLRPMLELANNNPGKIVFPSINGSPSSPTMFSSCFCEDLMRLTGNTGGRAVRAAYPNECLTYEAENPETFLDIDNEEDYRLLCKHLHMEGKRNH